MSLSKDRTPLRIVLSKVGLDGHDRGIKVVARTLRDAGFHVIYTGLWQTPESVARAVADEDADWLGLSILSGAHRTQIPPVLDELRRYGLSDVGVIVGGIIPNEDVPRLLDIGVDRVVGPGDPLEPTIEWMRSRERIRPSESLLEQFCARNRLALARIITELSQGKHLDGVDEALSSETATGRIVAITGSGGVGKSTLIGKLVSAIRRTGRSVAVLACDPESPVSGGALLGDRVRMQLDSDSGVFVRSLTAASGQQSLARNLPQIARAAQVFGFDVVIVETAGAGQGDTAIRETADVVVVCLQPEAGDELQWQKAGLLEVADVVVVHKADLPGAERVESDVRGWLNLPGCREVPVLRVSAHQNDGIVELCHAIDGLASAARNVG